jgi:NAD(P)-dependent dehydrogenase (short-subunit alcohol dehydrogenase family)
METGLREAAPARPIWRHRRAGGAAAAWLASGEADSITGAILSIDGGMTLYPGFVDNG